MEIREFVLTRLRPHTEDWETAGWFPNPVFGWLAESGYLGLRLPPEYGGGGDPVAAAVLVEELARCGSGGMAAGLGLIAGLRCRRSGPSWHRGADSATWFRIAGLAITEPDAGSDVASIRTRARRVRCDRRLPAAAWPRRATGAGARAARRPPGPIGGGTDEIMKEILGRLLGL